MGLFLGLGVSGVLVNVGMAFAHEFGMFQRNHLFISVTSVFVGIALEFRYGDMEVTERRPSPTDYDPNDWERYVKEVMEYDDKDHSFHGYTNGYTTSDWNTGDSEWSTHR